MKKVVHKLMALAALVGMGLPVVQAQAQEQPNVLPVVSLVPKDATPRIGRNALVKINLVGADNVVHRSLYYTSFNTVDITLGQVASLLGSSYDIELAPQNVQTDTHLKNYVTDHGEFYGSYLAANFVLKNPDQVPIEKAEEPVIYPVTVLEEKGADLFYEQLVTVDVKDQAGTDLATTHYLINSDSTESPVDLAAASFTKEHPEYQVDAQTAQLQGSVNRQQLEEVLTSLGTVNVFRSHYVLTAVQAAKPQVAAAEPTAQSSAATVSNQARSNQASQSQEATSSAQAKDNKAEKPAPSKKEEKIDTVKKEVSQSPSKKVDAPANLAKKDSQSEKANKSAESPAPVAAATPSNKIGRQLPNTGEVHIGIISIVSLGLTLIGFLIVLAEKRRLRR